jgi:hypothetical protein
MIAEELNINRDTAQLILTENLGTKKVSAKMQRRREFCAELLQRIEKNDEWLNRLITEDESWAFQYDPETKR